MLRHRADLRTLFLLGVYGALVALAYVVAPLHPVPGLLLFLLLCGFSWIGAVATHNTMHHPIFHSDRLNRGFEVALTLWYGHPVSGFVPVHNASHHRHLQSERDVMRTSKARFGWNLLNLLAYVPTVAPAVLRAENAFHRTMARRSRGYLVRLVVQYAALYGTYAALAVLDPLTFAIYVWIPHRMAAVGIITMNLLQHDGCDETSRFDHSRNFVDPWLNWFTMNNGYHTIHHLEPGRHWSELAARHESEVKPHIHPELDEPTLLGYIWKAYVSPGIRRRFDGARFAPRPSTTTEPFVRELSECP